MEFEAFSEKESGFKQGKRRFVDAFVYGDGVLGRMERCGDSVRIGLSFIE